MGILHEDCLGHSHTTLVTRLHGESRDIQTNLNSRTRFAKVRSQILSNETVATLCVYFITKSLSVQLTLFHNHKLLKGKFFLKLC
jgi:hypothetical protein